MRNARYAVALVLDDMSGTAVHKLAQRLHTSIGISAAAEFPPHVTLAVCTGLDLTRFEVVLRESVATAHALECTLAAVGIFPTPEGVVYLGVAPSLRLVELQTRTVECLRNGGAEVEPYWIPGQWIPHCTLATGLPLEVIPRAIEALIEEFAPFTGVLQQVCVVEAESAGLRYAVDLLRPPC
jgi:2'-5' RNA ligase